MNIPRIIDGILSKFVGFVAGLAIGAYFTRGAAVVAFAVTFAICASELYLAFIGRKSEKRKPAVDPLVRRTFVCADDRYALETFRKALSFRHTVTRERKFIGVDGTALFCRIKPAPLCPDALVDMLAYAAKRGFTKAVVLTDSYLPATAEVAEDFPGVTCRLLDFVGVERLLKSLDALPKVEAPKVKRDTSERIKRALSSRRANGYLLLAAVLLVASRFATFSTYYLAMGCAALVLGVTVRFFGKKTDRR